MFFQKLQGFRSYEGYAGLPLKIFPLVPKVTRLRKLRCFLEIFKFVLPKVTRFQKLRRFRRAFVEDFPSCPKSYEVTRLRPKLLSNPSTYLATTVCRDLSRVRLAHQTSGDDDDCIGNDDYYKIFIADSRFRYSLLYSDFLLQPYSNPTRSQKVYS